MKRYFLLIFTFLILNEAVIANIKLPLIFRSNMVLQRDKDCAVWGTADAKEKVSLQLNGNIYKAVADKSGKWKIVIPPQPAGGPFQMTVK